MSVEKTYRCDLCRQVLSLTGSVSGGVGFNYNMSGSAVFVPLDYETPRNHLCQRCIDGIVIAAKRSAPRDTGGE